MSCKHSALFGVFPDSMLMTLHATFCKIYNPCLAVVLPPLPGEEGEIYDDVVDPNLDVR